MTQLSLYAGGHLFSINNNLNKLEKQLASKLGGLSDAEFQKFDLFRKRIIELTDYANSKNCSLYVDAE